uniref:Uncharacterized protein n=1 Tax=Entomoneis paludosa TaxID=265537 RepID=A0A7S2YRN2_9STRA|mmetsp:Transcript_7310/g.15241  ORF Transcript_7310/g.15241 Transcript_7310/m.15241 type:complete len:117 (+) Transcript_7310:83-433(+)
MTEDLKPGQKFPTPTPGFGDRVFYETLLRQRPDSAMAQEWCVSYGVLPRKEAKRLNQMVLERKRTGKSSGVAVSSPKRSGVVEKKKKKKKARVLEDDDAGPDMQRSGAEGIGRSVL